MISTAYYAPYPGSVLGYQIAAEKKSLIDEDKHNRGPGNRFVKGIDYNFLDEVLRGQHQEEAMLGRSSYIKKLLDTAPKLLPIEKSRPASHFYLFDLKNGKKKVAFGVSKEEALENLKLRLTPTELSEILIEQCTKTTQLELQSFKHTLG